MEVKRDEIPAADNWQNGFPISINQGANRGRKIILYNSLHILIGNPVQFDIGIFTGCCEPCLCLIRGPER
jgi:hypothetical protein